jgi:hypothetical protein
MKKPLIAIAISFLIAFSTVNAHADLDNFLSDLNVRAKADRNGFDIKLSSQFGVPLPQVQSIIKTVEFPADAFLCLQLGQMTNQDPDRILKSYKKNKKKGWGAIAKELGIKPGSAEFHALKNGDFSFTGKHGSKASKGQDKHKSKDKGKDKKKKKDKKKDKDKGNKK